jgi:hypothetical protein
VPLSRLAAIAGLTVGLVALTTQFVLTIPARMSAGHDLLEALLFFFTYFTILTNLMLVLIYASTLVGWSWLAWWRSPVTRGMTAGAIALVMGFYHFVLASTWNPEGWFLFADILLHYVTPVLYIGWWLAFEPKRRLVWRDIGRMLVPPALWLAWAMGRGAVIGEYPYPVLEANRLGYPAVALNILGLLMLLSAIFAAVVAADRSLGARRANPPAKAE